MHCNVKIINLTSLFGPPVKKKRVLIVNNTGCTLFTLFMEHDILVNAYLTELTFMLLQIC